MRVIAFLLIQIILLAPQQLRAQIENVIVETYYISDHKDQTDTFGGNLEEGSITYRIFIDLLPGSKLLSIFGSEVHPLIFSSTNTFFNHRHEGVSFGKDINRNRYETGTVALDTYITLGQSSRQFAQGAYFGIPKNSDPDGSFIGGINNDGGSEQIKGGLLVNDSIESEAPLYISDGLTISREIPDSWIDIGFKDILTKDDTTIFASNDKLMFSSHSALLRNSGVYGIDSIKNEILVAQLTTKGTISFELNIELEILKDGKNHIVKYVARNELLDQGEVYSPLLKFPYLCGCTDPDYLEASSSFACTDNSQCITPVIIGCSDSMACNYNPLVNFNLPELCCYQGYCPNLDIEEACPDLQPGEDFEIEHVKIYPNPASTELNVELFPLSLNDFQFKVLDVLGTPLLQGNVKAAASQINISDLMPGYYLLQMRRLEKIITISFIKV